MMKLLNTILLLLSAFTGYVTAQNDCACYPLQYNFRLDLLDLKRECDYTYQSGVLNPNDDEGPNPIPPGIANLHLAADGGVGNPAAFEYVGCSTIPTITPEQIVFLEIEEFGPNPTEDDPDKLSGYEWDPDTEPPFVNGNTITYDSITATDPTAIVKTLKVYMGLRQVIQDANGNDVNLDQDFEFEVRYSNICDAVPYTENDFAGYLNFDSSVVPNADLCFTPSSSPSVSVAPSLAPSVACDEGSKGSKGSKSSSKGSKSSSKGSGSSSKGSKSSKSCKSPKSPTMSKGSKSSSFKSPTLSSSKGKGSSSSGKGSKSTSLKLRRREAY